MNTDIKHLLDETESNISLLHPNKVILGEAELSPILFCTGAINWMLDEAKSNNCFIIPKKIDTNKLVFWNPGGGLGIFTERSAEYFFGF